ncbi:MAG TPA: GNAT family N-acetyltransferase [Microvirga sp.]|nr:GNAT family N-acetyltransferase [Microvirga sp.]
MMPDIRLRHAALSDMGAVARLNRHVRKVCFPYLPELHTPDEDLAFFRNEVFPLSVIWLAEAGEDLVGFAAVSEGWLDHLYVHPSWHGRGVGSTLLERAKEGNPQLDLWTFQRNAQARRFYEHRGFRLVELTDGSANEEQEPDAHYRWIGD